MRRVFRDVAAAAGGGGEGTRLVQMRDGARHLRTVKKTHPPVAALQSGGHF